MISLVGMIIPFIAVMIYEYYGFKRDDVITVGSAIVALLIIICSWVSTVLILLISIVVFCANFMDKIAKKPLIRRRK